MTKPISSETLHKLVDQYEANAKQVKALANRVRTLTRQRDQANARNAELRHALAGYQHQLAEARTQLRAQKPSAWSQA